MLCYRCGGHVKDGAGRCVTCGQSFDPGLKAGPAAGFGAGIKKPRHAVEGAPCQPGDIIGGRYQIRDHAGAGPLGWMFRAAETTTDDAIALKILSPRFLQMPEERRTFVDELHKAQRLAHPNIARIYEAGDDAGRPFIAMQLLEGLTLRRIMDLRRQKGQRFTLAEVEPIVAQIAAALDAASASFAHGNLKPDNVIVLPDLLKLTDFGLAVSLPRAPFMAAQKAAGVHRYLAPEFLLGEPLDARTDVFSLGVLLGEMLSGAQYEAQLSLLDKNPSLPEAVEALFRRAVSPRPGARFASAGEMAAELSDLLGEAPRATSARQVSDVVIIEAQTDPRVRIARALGATRAQDPAVTPQPPAAEAPLPAPAQVEPPRTQPDPPRAGSQPAPPRVAPLDPAALAALSALPLPAFTPPPYEPPAPIALAPLHKPAEPAPAPLHAPAAEVIPLAAASEPPIAPVAEPPSEELRQIAASVGATPSLLTADTAVRPAPEVPEPEHKPRRGAGRRKDKFKGRRRSAPPGAAAGADIADPAWASSAPPPTEGALAIGPTTPALEPIEPDVPRLETPAPMRPVQQPAAAPARASQPAVAPVRPAPAVSRPPAPVSFGAMEDKRPSRAPLYAMGAVALIVIVGGGISVLSSRGAQADARPAAEAAPAGPAKAEPARAEPAKPEPAKAEPPKAEPKKDPAAVVPSRRDPDPAPRHSMRDRVRAVKERVDKALEDRRRQREEAVAAANAKRAAEKKAQPAPAPPAPAAAPAAAAPTPAPKGPVVQPNQPPPSGAISGLGDTDVMVSKDRGRAVAAASVAGATSAAQKEYNCPPGMQKVPGGIAAIGTDASDDLRNFGDRSLSRVELKPYCIDQYEFPNQPGHLPKVAAPWAEAESLCRNAGKRLCSEEEWEAACRGPQNLRFPYGTRYDPDACNTTDGKDNPRQTNVSGAFTRCKSGYNVWDLSGNAAEWTASAFDGAGADKTVKGGHAARPGFDDRCASRRKLAPGAHAINVGFRCCADAR